MATATWRPLSGAGNWSTASNWGPVAPGLGDSVVIGSSLDTGNLMVTEDVTLTIGSLKLAAKTGNSGNTTTLNVVPGAVLTANGAISLGANTIITGTGTLVANGAISGGGKITASSGLLDLEGSGSIASGGAALAIGTAVPSTLELNLTGGITASSVAISSAFQTLLIGAAGSVTFTATEKVVNGTVQMAGGTLTDASGINLGSQTASGTLSGFGTVAAAISRSGTGVANLVTAIGGLLDLKGNVTGIGLAIDALAPARLMLEGTVSTPTAIAISSPNQTLEIGPSGKLTIQAAETATNGTIQLDGGALVDTAGITIGSGATLTGFGSVSGGLAGTGVVKARGGVLDLLSGVTSTATTFVIDPTPGSVLELAGAASLGTTFTFAGPSGKLELADIVNGVVQGFNGTIAGLNIGASASVPTNAVNIRTTVTSATLSGNAITVSNGGTTVATLRLSSAQPAGTRAVIAADATLGGYDVFLAPAAPTVSWSPNAKTGVEGQTIALGTIVPASGNPLQSVTVSGIPAGATLSDGVNSFAATSGNTSTNIIGWNYAALTLTPSNDTNATLTAQVTDTGGNTSAPATETVTVTPLAPGVAPVAVSGSAGQPIPLNLGLSVNGLTGDANTLSTVTISNIPSGATLSNSHGDTLTITNGSITLTAAQLAGGVLAGLALAVPSAGTFTLGVSATEQDSEGNLSTGASSTEQLTATAPVIPAYSHIVVVFEDQQPYLYNRFNYPQGIIGNPSAPYINDTLVPGGALLTNYTGVSYPGEPNYLAAYAGSTFGITDNGSYSLSGPTLATILAGAGKSFTGYVEQQNAPQDPWLSFPEGASVQQNFTAFPSGNFANLPTVSFVMPSLDDDMDAGTVGQGDTWLRNNLGAYAQWALNNNSLLVVTTSDDGDHSQGNHVATVLYGANVTPGTSSASYNDYDLLNTLLAGYGLTAPNNAASAAPIQVFNPSTGTGAPPSVAWSATTVAGAEGQAITLGALTLSSSNPLQSVLVSGIPVGTTLSDGTHSFTAQLGSTAVNILGWNYAGLSITTSSDGNMSLVVQATDNAGNRSAAAVESVTVAPPAPSVTPLVATGLVGHQIGLIPGVTANGLTGEGNSIYSLTLSGIPNGAALSNANGDALAVNNGSITFSATQLAGGVLNGLAMTVGTSGQYTLGVSAIEQDVEGDLSASASSSEVVTALSPLPLPTYSHIVVVIDENRDPNEIVGSPNAPFINNTLISGGALLTDYWAPTHPSGPDHLALYAGSTFGITDAGVNTLPDPTLDTVLANAGKTFVGYSEAPASYGFEPWLNFPEGASVGQDFSAFPQGNFNSLPTVSFVKPNLDNDMHSGTVAQGDTWLQNNIGAYAQWASDPANNSLLVFTFDESDAVEGPTEPHIPNQVATVLYGADVIHGTYSTPYSAYNLLSTLVDGYGQVGPNYSAQQGPIQVFDPPPSGNVFTLDSNNTSLVLSGPSNMVFLGGATGATITDDPSGADHLKLVVEPAGGSVSITNFSVQGAAEVDLPMGFGGLTNASQVLAALQPDQSGGTLLQVPGQLSVDFVGVTPNAFQPSNFQFV